MNTGPGNRQEVRRSRPNLEVYANADALALAAAEAFVLAAREAQDDHGRFLVALSGGSTPRAMYRVLATPQYSGRVNWDAVQVFFSDERFVPSDSEESNYHLAQTELLSRVGADPRKVHRVATVDIPPHESAALYEQGIRRVFEVGLKEIPRFDLIFLGLGPDGHTASLFPDTKALTEKNHLVAPNFVPRMNAWRISFTYPLLNAASQVAFLVQGEDKASILKQVLGGASGLPAEGVAPTEGRLVWLVDRAAISALDPPG